MTTLSYGQSWGSAMEDHLATDRSDPGKSEASIKAWAASQQAAALYRMWRMAVDAPPEAFSASGHLPAMALAALDALEDLGVDRRAPILAEALDSAVGSGSESMVAWLAAQGAPSCPALGRLSQVGSVEKAAARVFSEQGCLGGVLADLSWCALAARKMSMSGLAALEGVGWGAGDRAALFDGLAGRFESRPDAIAEMARSHPWVAAAVFEPGRGKGSARQASAMLEAWRPRGELDLRACVDALDIAAVALGSARGAAVLATERLPMGAESKVVLARSLAWTCREAGLGSKDCARYAKAAMDWCSACEGPASGEVLEILASRAREAIEDKAPRSGCLPAFYAIEFFQKASIRRGAWSKADPAAARAAGESLASAAAGERLDEGQREALGRALASIDKMSGAQAPAKRGALRM